MQAFRELEVWKRGHALAVKVYEVTARFPRDERFGITDQLRRAAVSIPTNIAEGSKRRSQPDYARFLNIAEGSAAEIESLLLLCQDLTLLPGADWTELLRDADRLGRMLHSLRRRVESSPTASPSSLSSLTTHSP